MCGTASKREITSGTSALRKSNTDKSLKVSRIFLISLKEKGSNCNIQDISKSAFFGWTKLRLEKLYYRLKSLINGNIEIHIKDNVRGYDHKPYAEVTLVSSTDSYHWTHFRAETIEKALREAIHKLLHPEKNYVDEDGQVWKAKDRSVYSAEHIRTFLKDKT